MYSTFLLFLGINGFGPLVMFRTVVMERGIFGVRSLIYRAFGC